MKRSLLLSLVLLLFLAACSGAAPSGSADSVSVGSAASSESAGSTPAASGEAALIEGAQRWEETEGPLPDMWDFHSAAFDPAAGHEPVTREFTPVDHILVSGKYTMPVITNETPLKDMIVSISGTQVIILENLLSASWATEKNAPALRDLWGETQTLQYIPVTFLRRTGESSYYTVCRVDGGGYAYFFFDRLRDSETGSYLTEDLTDVYLYGAIYAEERHSDSEFADIKPGDSIDKVAQIDHKVYFDKNAVAEYWLAGVEHTHAKGQDVWYIEDPLFTTLLLLDDGILQIAYQYNDPNFDVVYDENSKPHYEYDYSLYKVIDTRYYPDNMVSPYMGDLSELATHDGAYNLNVLDIDR